MLPCDRARLATASNAAAAVASGPTTDAARCHAARSETTGKTVAKAACAARAGASLAAPTTAERTSG